MNKTINIDVFSPSSIRAALRELRQYQDRLERKAEELRRRVAELIRIDAQAVFDYSVADDRMDEGIIIGGVDVEVQTNGDVTLVIASGKDVVFMEFGAGVFYNGSVGSSPHPLGAGLGYTIGSYGNGNGAKEVWGWRDDDGFHLSHGAPASMPLYKAVMNARNDLEQIAREVFST